MIVNNLIGSAAQAVQGSGAASAKPSASDVTKSFGEFLNSALDSVEGAEKNAHQATNKFMIGQADVSEVMIASQQAELSLQLTTQVRNKLIEAYQEIMRTQI